MSSKTIKIISMLVIILMVISTFSMVFANDEKKTKEEEEAAKKTSEFLDIDRVKPGTSGAVDKAQSITGKVLAVVQVIAVAIAVIMLTVLAVKYISAAPAEKGDIKKGMVTYVVGALLLFGATGILQIIKGFAAEI